MQKKNIFYLSVIAMTFTLSACNNNAKKRNENSETKTVLVQGEKPEIYYKNFIYNLDTTRCGERIVEENIVQSEPVAIATADSRTQLRAQIVRLKLSEDGKFEGLYKEMTETARNVADDGAGNPVETPRPNETVITGTWQITESGGISFSNLGQGTSTIYNNIKAINLKIEKDIMTPGFAGKAVLLTRVKLKGDPDKLCNQQGQQSPK